MTAPKNDKARKAWLAGLKDGDEAAWLDRDTYRVGVIRRDAAENEIKLIGKSFVLGWFTNATGKGVRIERTDGWLIPVTDEIRANVKRRNDVRRNRERLNAATMMGSFGQFTDDQILAVSAILWPEQSK